MKILSLDDLRSLFRKVVVPFHLIERDMTLPAPSHRPDNDAEHSWSLAFMALTVAAEIDPDLDLGKIAIYAIVHDVVEVYSGDTSVWAEEERLTTKQQREADAIIRLQKELPQFPNLHKFIAHYESRADNEAKFVYALDKFLNLLTITEDSGYYYHTKHKITKARYDKQLTGHKDKAHSHPLVAKYYDQLRDEFDKHPEHFYQAK